MGSRHAVIAVSATALLLFFLGPVAYFAVRAGAAGSPGELSSAVAPILSSLATWRTVGLTTAQAALSALLAVVLGLPAAYAMSHLRFPLKRFFHALTLIPFVLPSIIVVLCMVSFWGRSGVVGRLTGLDADAIYSFRGILVAHVFYNLSLAVRVVAEGWEEIDRRYQEGAASLGDGARGTFRRITVPLLAPSLLTAFLLVFLYCFLSFGVVLVFGGARFATLEVRIYREMYVSLDMAGALTYALLQLALSLLFMVGASLLLARSRVERGRGARRPDRRFGELPLAGRVLLVLYAAAAVLFLLGPLLSLAARALAPRGVPSLESFAALFVARAGGRDVDGILRSTVPRVVGTSLLAAACSGTLAFAVATAVAFALGPRAGGWYDALFQLPMGLSMVTLCIGLDLVVTDVAGTALPRLPLVILVQAMAAFPVVYRIARTSVAAMQHAYVESARSLGAGKLARLRDVELPLLRRGLLNAYAYGMAIAFADFTGVMTVGHGDVVTFPVAIYRLIGFRSFDLALALGVLYVLICVLLFIAIDGTSRPGRRPTREAAPC